MHYFKLWGMAAFYDHTCANSLPTPNLTDAVVCPFIHAISDSLPSFFSCCRLTLKEHCLDGDKCENFLSSFAEEDDDDDDNCDGVHVCGAI